MTALNELKTIETQEQWEQWRDKAFKIAAEECPNIDSDFVVSYVVGLFCETPLGMRMLTEAAIHQKAWEHAQQQRILGQ